MNTYVYGDVILLENFIINYLILWSTAKFLKLKSSILKYIISAILGSLYALLAYFPQYSYMFTMFMKILFSLLMVIIAFTPSNVKEFAKITGVFYIITFIFGGASFGLYYFVEGLKTTVNGVSQIEKFPVKTLILSIIFAYVIVRYCWDYVLYKMKRERVFTDIVICLEESSVRLTALVDTGNSLREPITKSPVIIAEYAVLKALMPNEVQRLFDENSENNLNLLSAIMASSELATRFRVIPFKSLGKENGMLIGFKPDEVLLCNKKESLSLNNIVIGIYNKQLSNSNEYSALMHPEVFEVNGKAS